MYPHWASLEKKFRMLFKAIPGKCVPITRWINLLNYSFLLLDMEFMGGHNEIQRNSQRLIDIKTNLCHMNTYETVMERHQPPAFTVACWQMCPIYGRYLGHTQTLTLDRNYWSRDTSNHANFSKLLGFNSLRNETKKRRLNWSAVCSLQWMCFSFFKYSLSDITAFHCLLSVFSSKVYIL